MTQDGDGAPARPVSPTPFFQRARPFRVGRAALWVLLVAALALQAALRGGMNRTGRVAGESPQTLYVSSGVWLRRLSLGYEGLAADIYWTRAIQYFGTSRLSGQSQFRLLEPLLSVTTTLDPQLIVAYRFGALFLAEKPPAGAGRPQQAMQLLWRGMAANPGYWRFWEDLGFIEYWDLHDYRAAARYFKAGSQRPGAPIWMKTVAASVAAKGGELRTSQALWTQVYRSAANETVRRSALDHLAALKATEDIRALDEQLLLYQNREGRPARSFEDLVSDGLLRAAPVDPSGAPYALNGNSKAALGPASKIDLGLAR